MGIRACVYALRRFAVCVLEEDVSAEVQEEGGSALYYAGIDYHKRYSIVSIQNSEGSLVQEQRVDHAFAELFGGLFRECPEPVAVVYESPVNWSWLYEILQPVKNVSSKRINTRSATRLFKRATSDPIAQ